MEVRTRLWVWIITVQRDMNKETDREADGRWQMAEEEGGMPVHG